jgi:hypothetical protein
VVENVIEVRQWARWDEWHAAIRNRARPDRRAALTAVRGVDAGLPEGWVTDVPGLSRTDQLKALGNGVVPQQAALALSLLLDGV